MVITNLEGSNTSVLASTNVAAPLNTWSNLGLAVELTLGTFQFTDLEATNYPQRYYRVRGPCGRQGQGWLAPRSDPFWFNRM